LQFMNIQSVSLSRSAAQERAVHSTVSLAGWGRVHVAGDTRLLNRPSVAVVGSRSASHEGRALAAAVASELVRRGLVVLSGLAAGIDKAAHEAAMLEGGRTIAVLGTSLDQAYPRHHAGLQDRIATEHRVVSPFESGTPTPGWHFPKRNRLMAHLARAMVLVEAGAASGTRHQVDECLSLGKPVFVHASLLEGATDWLTAAQRRGGVRSWRDAGSTAAAARARGARGGWGSVRRESSTSNLSENMVML
jgi:DNA processing protein